MVAASADPAGTKPQRALSGSAWPSCKRPQPHQAAPCTSADSGQIEQHGPTQPQPPWKPIALFGREDSRGGASIKPARETCRSGVFPLSSIGFSPSIRRLSLVPPAFLLKLHRPGAWPLVGGSGATGFKRLLLFNAHGAPASPCCRWQRAVEKAAGSSMAVLPAFSERTNGG